MVELKVRDVVIQCSTNVTLSMQNMKLEGGLN